MIEHKIALFWSASGFMAGVAVTLLAMHLWRANEQLWAVATAALMLVLCFGIYYWVGGSSSETPPAAHPTADNAAPGSMEEAANKLATKLAGGAGSDEDWNLLARTYEFLGDAEAAQLAGKHQLKTVATSGANLQAASPAEDPAALLQRYQQLVTAQPRNAAAWLGIAQLQRNARQFTAARQAYETVIDLQAMDADAWADYADVRASLSSLSDAAVTQAIAAALRMNPQQPQALWLQASAAHEERRYADAVQGWQRLRAALPDSSPDAAVIDANLAEDLRLSGVTLIQAGAAPAMSSAPAQVRGSVDLDAALKTKVTSGMVLFIYAKAEDSPAPVAAYRGTVTAWPVKFVLDDSHAMMPARKLSMYPQVRLEARLSRSGQAIAGPGDLQAEAVTVSTHSNAPIALKINRVIQ